MKRTVIGKILLILSFILRFIVPLALTVGIYLYKTKGATERLSYVGVAIIGIFLLAMKSVLRKYTDGARAKVVNYETAAKVTAFAEERKNAIREYKAVKTWVDIFDNIGYVLLMGLLAGICVMVAMGINQIVYIFVWSFASVLIGAVASVIGGRCVK